MLLGAIPTRYLIVGTGGFLVLVGLVLGLRFNRSVMGTATLLLAAAGAGMVAVDAESPCERESPYYCIAVREEGADPSHRRLFMDSLLHAFVDVDDPSETRLSYIQWFAAATDDLLGSASSGGGAGGLDAVHIGGGGFSFPRYLRAVDPGSRHVVLELDPVVLDVARRELGFTPDPAIEVRLGDARGTLRDVADDGADLVVGDAFGGLSVPWHLTTREFVADIDRVLRPAGRYIANLIDGPNLRLVRAEVATLQERFQHLAVVTLRTPGQATSDSNIVVVASHTPIDVAGLRARVQESDVRTMVIGGADVTAFAAGARPLWDDFAPTDQLLGR
jgi:hypothetical protein